MNFLMHKLFKFLVMSILVILLKTPATLPNTKYIKKATATSFQPPTTSYFCQTYPICIQICTCITQDTLKGYFLVIVAQ
ncbi:hypothetical protein Hanom_Chr00s016172g01755741 [Helianthus anomalus]